MISRSEATFIAALSLIGLELSSSRSIAQVTRADYERAERFLSWNAERLISGDRVEPHWLSGDRFWYRNRVFDGYEFILVDLNAKTRQRAFDHARMAAALSGSSAKYDPLKLPFDDFEIVDAGGAMRLTVNHVSFVCDLRSYSCLKVGMLAPEVAVGIQSPDRRWIAFTRRSNIWIRNVNSGDERQLSTDGKEHYAYGSVPEECCGVVTDRLTGAQFTPVLSWSPDSKKLVTYRLDERFVEPFHLLETVVGRPVLHSYRYAIPGDPVIPTYELFVFDINTGQNIRIDTKPLDMLRARDELMAGKTWKDVWFGTPDTVFFIAAERGYRHMELKIADANTGVSKTVLREEGPTSVAPPYSEGTMVGARSLNQSGKALWWSARDGWGHLYLYDTALEAQQRAQQLTHGEWVVQDVVHVDVDGGWVYFTAGGRERGRNPYFHHLYRVKLDGSNLTLLTPEDADHSIEVSPTGRFIVDTSSRIDGVAPTTVVRSANGAVVQTVESADITRLLGAGWRWPISFTVKAHDGTTDLYGVLYFPQGFDAKKKYPVIVSPYPGPSAGGVRGWHFHLDPERQPLAELGFIVMSLDAMGTPGRSKAFWDVWFGKEADPAGLGEFGIQDYVAALPQLGKQFPEMDLDRVGIWGHSGGGGAAVNAILRFPDIFKVAVASAGNHDIRGYAYDWGERWQGLRTRGPDGSDNYEMLANQRLAAGLKGKLLLAYGGMDDNVHPNLTLLLIQELINHNKDFDLLVMPNENHSFNRHPYVIRRTWDYFVRFLRGEEPPATYAIQPPSEPRDR